MALRAASQRRFQAVQAGVSPQSPANPAPAPALVYPPDAAIQAIKRFHIRPPFAEFSVSYCGMLKVSWQNFYYFFILCS